MYPKQEIMSNEQISSLCSENVTERPYLEATRIGNCSPMSQTALHYASVRAKVGQKIYGNKSQ